MKKKEYINPRIKVKEVASESLMITYSNAVGGPQLGKQTQFEETEAQPAKAPKSVWDE